MLKPELGYMCVGNGFNDMAMFKQAIDDGMIAAIMEDSSDELISEIQEYEKEKGTGRAIVIPKDKDKANRWIHRMAKVMESGMRKKPSKPVRNNKRLPDVQRVKVQSIKAKKRKTTASRKRFKER